MRFALLPGKTQAMDKPKLMFAIGDEVPYLNSRGNRKVAVITEITDNTQNGSLWFRGIDTITRAKVWYPIAKSKKLKEEIQ